MQFHRALRGPHSRAFLPCNVENLIDQPFAGLHVLFAENSTGDLHQVAIQLTVVPRGECLVKLIVVQSYAAFHQVVGLGDQLHDSVFDAVVNHLHVMAGEAGPSHVTQGSPFTWAAMASNIGRTRSYALDGPPG